MYNIIKSVINAGGYKLADIQYKAKKLYLMGDITENQLDELMILASGGANPAAERPDVLDMLHTLSDRITALEKRIDGGDEPVPVGYEEWKPWDGISDKYQPGAIVQHGGKLWESVFAGQNVWEPGTVGTETMWREYVV